MVGVLLAAAGAAGVAGAAEAGAQAVQDLPPSSPCQGAVSQAVDRAAEGAWEEAATLLTAARARCPADPDVLRELAAVRFQQGRLREARELAEALVVLAQDDARGWTWGWELLGTLAFLEDDARGALEAWNRVERPRVAGGNGTADAVRISGLATSEGGATGLRSGDLVTPAGLLRARRRLESLPSVARARVDYRPTPGGGARIEGAVTRHPPHTLTRGALPGHLIRALGGRFEVSATERLARGERLEFAGLADDEYRGASVAVRLPSSGSSERGDAKGGVAAWEAEVVHRVLRPEWDRDLRLRRSGARLRIHPWPGARVRGSVGVGGDRWSGSGPDRGSRSGSFAALEGRVEVGVGSSWLLMAEAEGWNEGFGRVQLGASGRHALHRGQVSTTTSGAAAEAGRLQPSAGWTLGVRGAFVSVLGDAPLELTPRFGPGRSATHAMRGTGSFRPPGRHWGHGNVEVAWLRSAPASLLVGGAVFLDGVRGLGPDTLAEGLPPAEGSAPRLALHAGGGVRVGVPGVDGWLRLDLAVPLDSEFRNRRPRVSVAWVSP